MLTLLSDYLDMAGTPEEKIQIEHAFAIFEKIELEDYEEGFKEIVMCEDMVDAGDTLNGIVQLTKALQHQILHDHAVYLSEDCSVEMLTNVIAGILDLQQSEEFVHIKETASKDAPVNEVFCELMQLVTKYSVEELLPHMDRVSPMFFTKVKEMNVSDDLEDDVIAMERVKLLHRFRLYDIWLPDGAPAGVRNMIKRGVDVGMPYTVYAGVVGSGFEQMEPDVIAEEMYGMAIISIDGNSSPGEIIKENMERYIANADTITAIMARVNQIVTGFLP